MRRVLVAFVLVMLCAGVACSGGSGRTAPKSTTTGRAPTTTAAVRGPEDLATPNTPPKTAASLERTEVALRTPTTPPEELARLGWEQQNAYRALTAHAEWVPDVLDRLPVE